MRTSIFARPYRSKLPSEVKTAPECEREQGPANPPPPVGDQFGPAYIGVSHIFSISFFSLILRLSSFLHDPIEYLACRTHHKTQQQRSKVDAHARILEQFDARARILEQFGLFFVALRAG